MKLETITSQTPRLFAIGLLIMGCGSTGNVDDEERWPFIPQSGSGGSRNTDGTGGRAGPISPPLGGASAIPDEGPQGHPLIGAGNYPAIDNSDPCAAAQHWELEVTLDMTHGALILKDGVVWKVTGAGVEHGWTMEMNAPPCTTPHTMCDDLIYEQLTTCTE